MYSAGGSQQSPYQFPHYQPKPALSERVADISKDTYTWLRDYVTAIKNGRLHPFTAVERKAREATRKDPWGPTGQQLAELADLSHHPEHAHVIFAVLEYRLTRGPEKWRNVYKALLVLEYLLIRGSSTAVQLGHSREVQHLLSSLSHFEAVGLGQGGGDAGVNVRLRSAAVLELLHDPQLLQQRRAAAAARFGQQQQPGSIAATAASGGPGGCGGYSREQMLSQQQQQQQQYGGQAGSNAPSSNGPDSYNTDSYNTRYNSSSSSLALNGFQGPSPFITNARPPGGQPPPQPPSAAAGGGGGFGEAKGVSFQENKLRISELRQLLQREENRRCADCQDASPGGRPTWASVNLGVFICMRCAGTHRGLGAHISKVRSCTLDTWLPEQVVFMAQTGNAAANAHFEALLPRQPGGGCGCNGGGSSGSNGGSNVRPARDSPEMAAFIRQKYADGKWVKPGSQWPPSPQVTPQPPPAAQQQQQRHVEVRIGARAAAMPAGLTLAPPAAAAAAGVRVSAVPPPQPPAAATAAVADLLCLGDDSSSAASAPAASGVGHPGQGVSQAGGGGMTNGGGGTFWDLMDAPMNVPPPNVSVIDWLDQRIQSGADAAAQAAADAARQQRHQLRHQQQQQQPVTAVFDPFVGAGAAAAAVSGGYSAPQALQQQQQMQPAPTAVTQPPAAAAAAAPAVKAPGVMHSFAAGLSSAVSHMSSHMTLPRGASNIIQTYEYTFSDSDSDDEDEEEGEQATAAAAAAAAAAAGTLVGPSKHPSTTAAATAAANGRPAGSAAAAGSNGSNGLVNPFALSQQQQQQQAQGSSSAGTNTNNSSSSSSSKKPMLIPATPGYHTSGPSPGFTGRPAAAAGFTGRSAAAGYTGRPAAAAAAAGFTGRSAAAGFTGQRPPGVYAGAAFRAPVVGFSGGWGGYYGMAAPQQSVTAAQPHSYSNGVTGGAGQAGMSHVPAKPHVSQQQ